MRVVVDKENRIPYYWQIADQLKKQILTGILTDGTILPSERVLAESTGVHRNTVIKAYGILKDEELVESVHGVGYRVTCGVHPEAEEGQRRKKGVNWNHAIKDEYQDMEKTFDDIFQRFTEESQISFSTGMAPAVFDAEKVAADFEAILHDEQKKPFYLSPYQGDLSLRKCILAFLREKSIRASLGQIQVLSEMNQAMDFIVTALLKPGDKVLLEEPVSPDVYRAIALAGCKAVTVQVDENGMICDDLETLIERQKPKFIFVNSSFHDPTGVVMSTERRLKLLDLANRYGVPIVEEDAASELAFDEALQPMTLKSMDRHDNVIYIYSFSLTFIPGLSLAFVVAPEKLIKSLSYLVSIRMISLDWMRQKLLTAFMSEGRYREKLSLIRELNRKKALLMQSCLDRLKPLGITYEPPKGGVYIWCRLPNRIDSREVARLCMKRGVSVIPGDVFYPGRNGGYHQLRLNFSFETEERILEGMKIFGAVIEELSNDA
ncbi:MAG: PLP-dependent aminotransferase family protein [Firmicutes bacterium]|nr:PLP-dependent aminotransferase family protein [Bacillota bacterium]